MCALHKPQLDVQGGHPSTLWSCKYCIFIISIHFHLNNSLTDGGGEYMDFFKSAKHTRAFIRTWRGIMKRGLLVSCTRIDLNKFILHFNF
jgi:hypothetical protein